MEGKNKKESIIEGKSESVNLSEWLTYYRILVDDIRFAKQQQWRLTYYTLLLLAAIIAISRHLEPELSATIVLFIIALALATAGTYYLERFQKDLIRYRSDVAKIRQEKFPPDLGNIAAYKPAEKDPAYYRDFLILLIIVIWVGLFLVGWAIKFWHLLFSLTTIAPD